MDNMAVSAEDWLIKGAVYQINPRTFSKEGTIKAVTKELPFLAGLGFKTMYLCPIFEADDSENPENWSERQKKSHTGNPKNPYRIMDYFNIDSEYGSEADLKEFIDESHRFGMRVLLDLVYMHIGPNAFILKTHPEFVKHDKNGNIVCSRFHFPYIDFNNEGLREYLWSNMVYFVGKLDADGYRCDVGDKVPLDFWTEGKRRMTAVKPDAVLINEGSDYSYLLGGFDACYCFSWHDCIYNVFKGTMTADSIKLRYEKVSKTLPNGGILLRDVDNHDTVTDWPERTETVAGHDGMELIQVMNYFIDGLPMVYCGNELADSAKLSMFANRFHMGDFEVTDRSIAKEDYSLRRQGIMKKLNLYRRASDTLAYGKTVWLDTDHPESVILFMREYNGERILFAGNLGKEDLTVIVSEALNGGELIFANGGELPVNGSLALSAHGYVTVKY